MPRSIVTSTVGRLLPVPVRCKRSRCRSAPKFIESAASIYDTPASGLWGAYPAAMEERRDVMAGSNLVPLPLARTAGAMDGKPCVSV